VATIRRVPIATTLVLAVLLSAPGHSTADPVDGAVGKVAQGLLDEPGAQTPSVTVGGGALPQVTVGGGGQSTTPPVPGAPSSQPQPGSTTPSSSPSGAAGNGADSGATRKGGTATSARRSSARNDDNSAATKSPGSPPAGADITGKSAQQKGNAPKRASRASSVSRVVSSIPPQFWVVLIGVGLAAALLGLLALHEMRRSINASHNALADPLTGLMNRAGFEQRLSKEWQRAKRYERGLGLLLIDLDDFKQVNDTQGHQAGDRVLREAAAAITGRIRETDMSARIGGDEFVVLCPETTNAGLETLAVGLERTLAEHGIGASAGHAQREPVDAEPGELIARADKAMYQRKRQRRHPHAEGPGLLLPA
jgi:diguanylate cyclase (GGDEF)-like protein